MKLSAIALLLTTTASSFASPRIESNSIADRHDMLLLRDYEQIESAVLTWPWPMGRSVANYELEITNYKLLGDAQRRFGERYSRESQLGIRPAEASMAFASDTMPFRSFGYQPREQFEIFVSTSWLSEWTAGKIQFNYADNPSDRNELHLDGSYFSFALGNWVAAIDQVERWWGPGWDGSLILSNNARPVPALSLTRISPEPFESKYLKWIGPWTFTTFMGQLNNDEGDRPGSNARLFGMRIEFTPFDWKHLDIGLSRTAQWAGDGRPGGLDTFWKLLAGEDNRVPGSNVTAANEPGNQLAGVDYRIKYPHVKIAHYAQLTGEDESHFLPDANMILLGVEAWGELPAFNATWRAYFEFADTRAGYLLADPDSGQRANRVFNTAYNHGIYREGYRYKGRSIGHAMDGDGQMRSIGFFATQENGNIWGSKIRNYDINRDGNGPNSVSIDPLEGSSIELFGELALSPILNKSLKMENADEIKINFGIHYISEENIATNKTSNDFGGHLSVMKKF